MGPYKKFKECTSEWYAARIPDKETREKLLSLIEEDDCGYYSTSLREALTQLIIFADHDSRWIDKIVSFEDKLLEEPIY